MMDTETLQPAVGSQVERGVGRRAGPWDALLCGPRCRLTPRAHETEDCRAGTKLAALLGELGIVESLPTAALGARCDLDSRQVWGAAEGSASRWPSAIRCRSMEPDAGLPRARRTARR